MKNNSYDYIIAGAGLAGLSLAFRIIHSQLADKRILVIDKSLAPENNKTWSFWHRGAPPFEDLVYKKWHKIKVGFDDETITEALKTYSYYSIRSGQFRKKLLQELREHPTVDLEEAPIQSMEGDESGAYLSTAEQSYTADYVFQSCLEPPKLKTDTPHYPLIQHFLGWEIEAQKDVFDSATVTLMDFDTGFTGGLGFVYILPWSPKTALVEYTIFSDALKIQDFYEEKLGLYLYNKFNLRAIDFSVKRVEKGQIPMQDHIYAPLYAPHVLNMGSIGGLTKPSTGYTFSRIQAHVNSIAEQLSATGKPALLPQSPYRYRAYDLWLLHIIYHHPATAINIFEQLFGNNSVDEIFRFLAEENTLLEDLKTMSKVSYAPFLRAMVKTSKRLKEI